MGERVGQNWINKGGRADCDSMLAESVSKAASGTDLAVDDDRFEAMIRDVNDEDEDEMDGKRVYRRVRLSASQSASASTFIP